jgi:hypothetical protein
MVTQTPRFDLNKYSQGEDNWSHSDTVELLDELAVETDVIANRSTSGNYDDELFYATDQKLLYRWDTDQTDWLIEGGLGSSGNRLPSLWANTVNSNVTKHATDISEDYTVDSGEGAVFAGPVTGTGSISGNGKISVIQEGHQFTDNVDAQGNDLNNVGSLNTEQANIGEAQFTGLSKGNEKLLYDALADTDRVVSKGVKFTDGVGTTETSIFDEANVDNSAYTSFLAVVSGEDGSSRFTDLVLWTRIGGVTTIGSTGIESPAARTYSQPTPGELGLEMGSSTYDVGVVQLSMKVL